MKLPKYNKNRERKSSLLVFAYSLSLAIEQLMDYILFYTFSFIPQY